MKHTSHSNQRAFERANGETKLIKKKLEKGDYIGLPRFTNSKRASLISLKSGTKIVAIWMKTTGRILTILTEQQYKEQFGVPKDLKKYFTDAL